MIDACGKFTSLHDFTGADGGNPTAGLARDFSGMLYGAAVDGGANYGPGVLFSITPSGTYGDLHDFAGPDGADSWSTLVQAVDGLFYGTTYFGGASNDGTVFALNPGGKVFSLHSLSGSDGSSPYSGLVQATDGRL